MIAGRERAHYGPQPEDFPTWKAKSPAELDFDHARLHFTGMLPKSRYAGLLQRSAAHVYLSQPFVLSWSLIEAMACGAPIVATDVAPVREALGTGRTSPKVPQGDPDAVVSQVARYLDNPDRARNFGPRARKRALAGYDAATCHAALETHRRTLLPRPNALRA